MRTGQGRVDRVDGATVLNRRGGNEAVLSRGRESIWRAGFSVRIALQPLAFGGDLAPIGQGYAHSFR